MKFKRTTITICLLVIGIGLLVALPAEACPTCKQGLENDPNHDRVVQGYFWSILFMMSMPFLTLSSLIGYFYYQVCKARLNGRQENAVVAGSTSLVAPATS